MNAGTRNLLAPLLAIANRNLAESSTAAALARDLEGRRLRVRIQGTPIEFRLSVSSGRLEADDEPDADAVLEGPPLSLLGMLGLDPQAPIRDGSVSMHGDTTVAERFRALLEAVRPDPEEQLSRLIGDPLARAVGQAVRGGREWLDQATTSAGRSLSEYLREERRLLPSRTEFDEFAGAVEQLRDGVDRAEARLRRLWQQNPPPSDESDT